MQWTSSSFRSRRWTSLSVIRRIEEKCPAVKVYTAKHTLVNKQSGGDLLLAPVNHLQLVILQDTAYLIFGVRRPRSRCVQASVSAPVHQSIAELPHLLVGQRQVVVGVGVGRGEQQRGLIRLDRLFHPAGLVQHITYVEISQCVAGIGLDRLAVMPFCQTVVLAVVVKRAQVDVRGGMAGIEFQDLLVSSDRLRLRARIFFQRHSASEVLGRGFGHMDSVHLGGYHFMIRGSEVHHELPRDGLHGMSLVTEGHPRAGGECARLEQRVLHAGDLLLHGAQRFPDHGGAHSLGAQVAHFLHLQQIKEGITVAGGYQPGSLPLGELTGSDAQNPQYVGSAVTLHCSLWSRSLRNYRNTKVRTQEQSSAWPVEITNHWWKRWKTFAQRGFRSLGTAGDAALGVVRVGPAKHADLAWCRSRAAGGSLYERVHAI